MKKAITVILILMCLCVYLSADPNDPNTIKLPEGAKMPSAKLVCPKHGEIGTKYVLIETTQGNKLFCKRCTMDFMAEVLRLNLPKLEVKQYE